MFSSTTMRNRIFTIGLILVMLLGVLSGCGSKKEAEPAAEPAAEPVVLTIAGSWTYCRAIDEAAAAFKSEYPNCTIQYEYLQDYYPSVLKRMEGDAQVDLFFTTNIQSDSELFPYVLDLNHAEGLDLSNTFDGLIENFAFLEDGVTTETPMKDKKLYSIPLGAEMRGLYINKTLLDSLDIEIPTNQKTLMDACAKLKENGYIPFQGNPGNFAQLLIYPWICNQIANADDPEAAVAAVEERGDALLELLREPYEFLYSLVQNDYFDYKTSQTDLKLFNDVTDEAFAQYFFNIALEGEELVKKDDIGNVAFMPSALSLQNTMDKTKDDYHSKIEYVFVPAPIGEDGGYAYLSPAHGIAANKNSANLAWSIKFLNFLFQPENNKKFAEAFHVIPNTKEAFSYITSQYNTADDHISHVGQVTFSYGFYKSLQDSLTATSKANNPKYMIDNKDGTYTLYPFDYYFAQVKESLNKQ